MNFTWNDDFHMIQTNEKPLAKLLPCKGLDRKAPVGVEPTMTDLQSVELSRMSRRKPRFRRHWPRHWPNVPAGPVSGPPADPDLAKIFDAWDSLAEPLKRAVLALIETAS